MLRVNVATAQREAHSPLCLRTSQVTLMFPFLPTLSEDEYTRGGGQGFLEILFQ